MNYQPLFRILFVISVSLSGVPIFGQQNATIAQTNEIIVATDKSGVEMVYVPAGTFEFGITSEGLEELCIKNNAYSPNCWDNAGYGYAEIVSMTDFWIDRYEVTVEQYQQCVDEAHCPAIRHSLTYPNENSLPQQPISQITWFEAVQFCYWRGARLPTEREWEYAASGPENFVLPWGGFTTEGGLPLDALGTIAGGSLEADMSWVGAYDMAYNVQEWVEDRYLPYDGQLSNSNERYDADLDHIIKGAAWTTSFDKSYTFTRSRGQSDFGDLGFGFRCARFSDPRR